MNPPFQVKKLHPNAKLPQRATIGSAGYDLFACLDKPIDIRAGEKAVLVPTGLAIFSDDYQIAGLIVPRSGLGHKQGLVTGNLVGVIDSDYQGMWYVSCWNRGQTDCVIIMPGDAIAQVLFVPVLHPCFEFVEEFSTETRRGSGGFGSTS